MSLNDLHERIEHFKTGVGYPDSTQIFREAKSIINELTEAMRTVREKVDGIESTLHYVLGRSSFNNKQTEPVVLHQVTLCWQGAEKILREIDSIIGNPTEEYKKSIEALRAILGPDTQQEKK